MTQANNVAIESSQINSSGILQPAGGGTGAGTFTANNVLLGNGTSAFQTVAPGTTGNVLTSNGTTWTSAVVSGFATGTVMLFYQSAAPTGWTQVTTQNNKALRVVSGTGGVAGGTVAFTTAFASQAVSGSVGTSGATTLSTAEMPSHAHSNGGAGYYYTPPGCYYALATVGNTGAAGGGGSHTHTGGAFTGTAINLAVQYIDVIIASKT